MPISPPLSQRILEHNQKTKNLHESIISCSNDLYAFSIGSGSPSHRGGLYSPYGGEAAERDIFTGPRSPMPPTSTTPSSGVGGPQPPRPPERVFLPPTAAGGAGTSAGYHHLPPSAAAYSTIIVPPPPPPQYGRYVITIDSNADVHFSRGNRFVLMNSGTRDCFALFSSSGCCCKSRWDKGVLS